MTLGNYMKYLRLEHGFKKVSISAYHGSTFLIVLKIVLILKFYYTHAALSQYLITLRTLKS